MNVIMKMVINILLYLLLTQVSFGKSNLPIIFLFLGSDEPSLYKNNFNNACVSGAQIIYSWKQLEPKKDLYDFTKIKDDLRYLNQEHKKLFIQIQDRSFEPNIFNVPDYIREDAIYHGGVAMQYDSSGEGKPITSGWVARV